MRISVKLRRTEHIKRAPPRVSDKYKMGEIIPFQHLARTYNDYSRASSRKQRLLALNLL